jgi:replication protein O
MSNKFQGFQSPNYTQVPDELFDELLPDLSGAEIKVLLYIIRRTFGFKKSSDNISLNQLLHGIISKEGVILDRGTGLSKKTLLETIKNLVEKNLITTERRRSAERGDEPTTYRLHILDSRPREDTETPRGIESTPGGVEKSTPGGSDRNYSSQETVKQQTDLHLRNSKVNTQEENESLKAAAQEPSSQDLSVRESLAARKSTPTSLADILVTHKLPMGKLAPAATHKKLAPTPQIMAAITEISENFADIASLRSNTSQAVNLWQQSGRSEAVFVHTLYEARSVTRQQPKVRKPMPYFWSVVRELLGIQHESSTPAPAAKPATLAAGG